MRRCSTGDVDMMGGGRWSIRKVWWMINGQWSMVNGVLRIGAVCREEGRGCRKRTGAGGLIFVHPSAGGIERGRNQPPQGRGGPARPRPEPMGRATCVRVVIKYRHRSNCTVKYMTKVLPTVPWPSSRNIFIFDYDNNISSNLQSLSLSPPPSLPGPCLSIGYHLPWIIIDHGEKLATITLCNKLKLSVLAPVMIQHGISTTLTLTFDNLTVLIAAADRPVPCIPAHPTVPTSPAFPPSAHHYLSAEGIQRQNSQVTCNLRGSDSNYNGQHLRTDPPSNPPDSLLCGLRLACRFEDTLLGYIADLRPRDTFAPCGPTDRIRRPPFRPGSNRMQIPIIPLAIYTNGTWTLGNTILSNKKLRGPKYQEPEKSTSIFRVRRITYPELQQRLAFICNHTTARPPEKKKRKRKKSAARKSASNRRAYSSRSPRHDLHIAAAGATHSRRASRAVYLQDLKRAYQYPVRSTSYMTT
ncbi:hypothetical protein CCUS01_12322 [Colletotrichum cuscutae]|uniref:Uncharacterized protein n=1 Tax=Colletotrichum cuscutae TaxID=1209917 RepID=A0AAI9TXE6_9PEZI|nr:hypothetical protein CCUS01_12322 [Colletotrichum cuscutae]